MLLPALTIALGAFLLFSVQPLAARFVLPWFGGASSVWTVAMLTFQSLLLLGYAFAHLSASRLRPMAQGAVQIALLLLSLTLLPVIPSASLEPVGDEVPWLRVALTLLLTVGGPFFLLSTTSPLLQAWIARRRPGRPPYRLYALSNAGSLAALLCYPLVLEPAFGLETQARLWSWAYGAFALLFALSAVRTIRSGGEARPAAAPSGDEGGTRPDFPVVLLWLGLAACGSTLLLAVTNELTQDVASVPFLWVLPLALYLLTFVITFDRPGWYLRRLFLPLGLLSLLLLGRSIWITESGPFLLDLGIWSLALFALCMAFHGELHRLRPAGRHLTAFYLSISAGGAAGGVFVGILSPLLFESYAELWVGTVGGLVLIGIALGRDRESRAGLPRLLRVGLVPGFAAVALLIVVYLVARLVPDRNVVDRARGFYGVLIVDEDPPDDEDARLRYLQHGRIVHGAQFLDAELRRRPTTYYGPGTGVGLAMEHYRPGARRRVGVVGLGAGTMAAFGREGDVYRFYEIDPAVVEFARRHFTFIEDSKAQVEIAVGDARISLEREDPQLFDVLVLDAFSGDAPPVHLLTREAFEVYVRHLAPYGVIAVNISNRHLDLAPVVWGAARRFRMDTALISNDDDLESGVYGAEWLLMSWNAEFMENPGILEPSYEPTRDAEAVLWSDDHASLWQLLF